jgi:hypothetical protein
MTADQEIGNAVGVATLAGGDLWGWLKPYTLSFDPSLETTDLLDVAKVLGGVESKTNEIWGAKPPRID